MDVENRFSGLRSENSQIDSFIIFYNKTKRHVNITWINYQGKKVVYRVLRPKQVFVVDTFVTHPWICEDFHTGSYLLLNNNPVFYPYPPPVFNQLDKNKNIQKYVVQIILPLYSLKELAQQEILERVSSPEKINELELPKTLIQDLFKIKLDMNNKIIHKQISIQ